MVEYKSQGSRKTSLSKRKVQIIKRVSITTGVLFVGVGGILLGREVSENRKTDHLIQEGVSSFSKDVTDLSNYSFNDYSKKIEEMLEQDIENRYEKDINELCSYLYLVDNYAESEDPMEKYQCKEELCSHYEDILHTSLTVLKNRIAESEQVDPHNIVVSVSKNGTVAKMVNGDIFHLHGDELRLANSIADFQGYDISHFMEGNNLSAYHQYLKGLSKVVLDSVKLVNKENGEYVEDYTGPDFVERIR